MSTGAAIAFDDRVPVEKLAPESLRQEITEWFSSLTGRQIIIGEHPVGDTDLPVMYDLDPVLWVGCDDVETARAAASLLARLCQTNARYYTASAMHRHVVDLDYEELLRKNRELEKSREEYRSLSENLEDKVREQVDRIEMAQREIYLRERLSTIGQLASGMAHEVNNPLGYILNNLRTAGDYVAELDNIIQLPDSDTRELLDDFRSLLAESLQGAEKVASLVADLKRFADIDNLSEKRSIPAPALVRAVVRMVVSALPWIQGRISIEVSQELVLHGHPGHLSQALYNVVHNAVLACEMVGSVSVRAFPATDGGAQIEIIDSGRGMDEQTCRRAMEPFFTTRKVGSGTGLGLSSARDVILAHGGTIELDSEPGEGTEVRIYLPKQEAGS